MHTTYDTRINFSCEAERLLREIIRLHMAGEQSYITIGNACATDKLNMFNVEFFFRQCGLRLNYLKDRLIDVLQTRGGSFTLDPESVIDNAVEVREFNELQLQLIHFFNVGIQIECRIRETIEKLLDLVVKNNEDFVTADMMETQFLPFEVKMIDYLRKNLLNLELSDNAYIFDKEVISLQSTNMSDWMFE